MQMLPSPLGNPLPQIDIEDQTLNNTHRRPKRRKLQHVATTILKRQDQKRVCRAFRNLPNLKQL